MASRSEGKHAQSLASWISTVMRPRPSLLHINRGSSAAVKAGSGSGGRDKPGADCDGLPVSGLCGTPRHLHSLWLATRS